MSTRCDVCFAVVVAATPTSTSCPRPSVVIRRLTARVMIEERDAATARAARHSVVAQHACGAWHAVVRGELQAGSRPVS